MFKRILAMLMLIAIAFTLTACGDSQEKAYKSASKMLDEGKYAEAAEKFEKLGSYEDASQMTMYAKALNEAESGNYDTALKAFTSLGTFKDCPQLIPYYTARQLESEGEYESAVEMYNENPLFKDSQERVDGISAHYFERVWEMPNYESQGRSYITTTTDSGLVCVVKNNLCGLMDSTGKLVVPCEYEYIHSSFFNGLAAVRKDG